MARRLRGWQPRLRLEGRRICGSSAQIDGDDVGKGVGAGRAKVSRGQENTQHSERPDGAPAGASGARVGRACVSMSLVSATTRARAACSALGGGVIPPSTRG